MTDKQHYILIAEDNKLNQEIYDEQLSSDYQLKIVDTGKKCLEFLEERIPDILILDIEMPDIHGFNVCQLLRKDEKYNSLAIIFVSAMTSEREQQFGLNLGANEFLAKPYKEEQLLRIIKKHLYKKNLITYKRLCVIQ